MRGWREAMGSALYEQEGFYTRSEPHAHFRTSVSASGRFGAAIARLAVLVDHALGRPPVFDLVDVGAGDGTLVTQVLDEVPPDLSARMRATAVEVRVRPSQLPEQVRWTSVTPTAITGLVMAHELLDNVPCDVVEQVDGQPRQVVVDRDGRESIGPAATPGQQRWLDAWWPLEHDGDRAECGDERDRCWAELVTALQGGLALAVDFGHVRADRLAGAFPAGTLTGYRDGRQVSPVPDGSCDITAHVAMDACVAAGRSAGAGHSLLTNQREALRSLGVTGSVPDLTLAHARPEEYVRQLSEASAGAELLDPGSLGSFWWLLQGKGVPVPPIGSDALSG